MARPRGAARPVRPRAGQRRRRGPPRRRRPGRRADEPQPRPRGGDLVPVRRRAGVGRRRRGRQDARLVVDHRPGRRRRSGGGCSRCRSGFKWFVDGLVDGSVGLRRRGERRGLVPAPRRRASGRPTRTGSSRACWRRSSRRRLGRNPAEVYAGLTERFGSPAYRRIDAPATPELKAALGRLSPEAVTATTLGGDPIVAKLTRGARQRRADRRAQGRDATQGWFAARPSGTENVTKLYAESFRGEDHLGRILEEAKAILDAAV